MKKLEDLIVVIPQSKDGSYYDPELLKNSLITQLKEPSAVKLLKSRVVCDWKVSSWRYPKLIKELLSYRRIDDSWNLSWAWAYIPIWHFKDIIEYLNSVLKDESIENIIV